MRADPGFLLGDKPDEVAEGIIEGHARLKGQGGVLVASRSRE
ncbi:hypothetical protein [Pseudarthrobacter sp. L1SW]|nr:hypothetical protein [Pseudarthrobacter sp. L1SW]